VILNPDHILRGRAAKLAVRSLIAAVAMAGFLSAQTPDTTGNRVRALITEAVDENRLVMPLDQSRYAIAGENDLGRIRSDARIEHMLLLLRRPAEDEAALARFLEQQADPKSPNFHRWLTAAEYGERFGPARRDLAAVTTWLQSSGFTVNNVHANRVVIDFSGSAAEVESAFHTQVHEIQRNGGRVFVSIPNPKIPAALAPAVICVASLNSEPHPSANAQSMLRVVALKTY
jgi:hypothetical protein